MDDKSVPGRALVAPRLRHSRRKVRETLELAACAIASAPDRWREIALSTRRAFGKGPATDLPEEPAGFLVALSIEGRPALPVEELEKIGSGGLNTVYRTRDRILRLPFVVRRPRQARSAAELEFFLRHEQIIEERMCRLPWHPVIPSCFGRMRAGDDSCEVYEYAPGINLRSYVATRGLTYGAILDIAWSAARGLCHLHSNGLIHADLKPENFCVEERQLASGRTGVCVWIIDFDTVTTPADLIEQIALGTFSGTPGYMPPETFLLTVPDDPGDQERMALSKDVYALGVSLSQIISGEVPELPSSQRTKSEPWPGRRAPRVSRLPASLPAEFRDLLASMSRDDWRRRPAIWEVSSTLRSLRRRLDRKAAEGQVVAPSSRQMIPRFEEVLARGPALGPYLVVNPEYAIRDAGDGEPGRIMEIEDAHGRRLLAIAFTFADQAGAQAFYEDRRRLLVDLNRVRRAHPALFWGTFSDLVRTEASPAGPYSVWFVRPLLPEGVDLREFLRKEPNLPVSERVAILRRVAEALAALEEAGYGHPSVTPRSIFFVPYVFAEDGWTLPFEQRAFFDVRAARPYHQELMNMAGVTPLAQRGPFDRTFQDLLRIATEMGLTESLATELQEDLQMIGSLPSWAERLHPLRYIEARCR
ncbi:MAG: protein kinase [Acidobacteria bacterium]|nr:protein kinase [Acidobacteriota bacterium]MCG3192220.1 hypothetical protein [Thermoanaerobaculia bacterium]